MRDRHELWEWEGGGVLNAAPVDAVNHAKRHDSFTKGITERTIEVAVQHEIRGHGNSGLRPAGVEPGATQL
jgi:hypothetical protein